MAEILNGSNSPAAIDKLSTGVKMPNADQPPVGDQPAGDTVKNGENIDLKIATAMQLGKVSNDLVDLEGGIKTNIILTEKDKTSRDNTINEAVEQKMASFSGLKRIVSNLPVIKQVAMAGWRAKAASAVSKSGDTKAAFEELDLEAKSVASVGSDEYIQRKARLALEKSGFADKVDSTDTIALANGEKVEKVDDPVTRKVNDALKNLYKEMEQAYKFKDTEAMKKAREAYDEKLAGWQKEGVFGDNQSNLKRKLLENKVVMFLVGDHSDKSLAEVEGLRSAANGVEDLVKHKVSSEAFDNYLDRGNLSLYNASMREGLNTKRAVNSVLEVVGAAGVLGGLVHYKTTTHARADVKATVGARVAGGVASGAVAGAVAGAAFGAIHGIGSAREKMSKAEIADATSGEAIITAEERAELAKAAAVEAAKNNSEQGTEGDDGAAEDGTTKGDTTESGTVENAAQSKKARIGKIYEKIITIRRNAAGEDRYSEINEKRGRKNAKDLYDTLERDIILLNFVSGDGKIADRFTELRNREDGSSKILIDGLKKCLPEMEGLNKSKRKELIDAVNKLEKGDLSRHKIEELLGVINTNKFKNTVKRDMKDTVVDIMARENLTNEKGTKRLKIDLIRYSEGNVDRERSLLVEKMVEANEMLGESAVKAGGDEAVLAKMNELRESQKGIEQKRLGFIVRQAMVDAVTGAIVGAGVGAVVGGVRTFFANKASVSEETAPKADNKIADTPASETVADSGSVGETVPEGEPQLVDDDGNGIYELKVGNETVVSEGDGGITFDAETGKMSDGSMEFLRSKGYEINETAETHMAQGARTTEGIYDYFKSSNAEAYGEGIETGNKIANIDIKGYMSVGGANRAADIVPAGIENDGDLVFQVNTLPNAGDIDVDKLQVVLTPSKDLGDVGIVLDVAPDGTVVVPADSVAASMFTQGNFSGGAMRVVQEVAGGEGGYNVLATASGSGTLESIGFTNPAEITTFSYTLNGAPFNVPSGVQAEAALATVGAESIRNSDPVEYTYQSIDTAPTDNIQGPVDFSPENGRNYISVNGAAENGNFELIQMPHREGNYNEMLDPFLSDNKDGANLLGQNLVRQMVDPDYEMTPEQADAAFIEALDSGRMSTNQVLHHILEAKGNSPEGIVSLRAKMGDFMYDIDGDGTEELIDTQEEINAVADMLKDSAEPEGYSAFVNDTYERFFEKMNGGEVRVVNYAENPYTYSEHGFINKMNNIIRAFAVKKTTPTGIGLEFVDKDGNSIYDEDAIRSIYRIPAGQQISMISDRLECGDDTQTTVQVIMKEATRKATENVETQVQTVPQGTPTTTTTTTTDDTPTVTPEPEPEPSPEPEPGLEPKTNTNPWEGNNPAIMTETTAPIDENTVSAGQEVVPEINTEGVNTNPADQVSWSEAPTTPVDDTGVVPVDTSPGTNDEAAEMLRQTEAALRNNAS